MAIKRYAPKYIRVYKYTDKESGETEDIAFMANAYLFPLFKSLAGVELGDALNDYKKSLIGIAKPDVVEALAKYDIAGNPDEKLAILNSNPDLILNALTEAVDATNIGQGLTLVELLLICSHVCALPESEHAEALAVGTELLPQEIYENTAFAFDLLELIFQYETAVKKNLIFAKAGNKTTAK